MNPQQKIRPQPAREPQRGARHAPSADPRFEDIRTIAAAAPNKNSGTHQGSAATTSVLSKCEFGKRLVRSASLRRTANTQGNLLSKEMWEGVRYMKSVSGRFESDASSPFAWATLSGVYSWFSAIGCDANQAPNFQWFSAAHKI